MIEEGQAAKTFLDWWPLSIPMVAALGAWFRNDQRIKENEKDIVDLAKRVRDQRAEDMARLDKQLDGISAKLDRLIERGA